jgi:hypothetical protein
MLLQRDINAPLPGTYVAGLPDSGVRPYGDVGNIFQYESAGLLNQKQWITNVNSRMNRNISIFTYYVLNYANSNTDGASFSPADPYNLALDYSRAAYDVRHRFVLGGSIVAPKAIRFSPFIIAHSGAPFNVTTGRDLNGDTLFNDRPAFAADPNAPGMIHTEYGVFDPNPKPGEVFIPRNFGDGPSAFTVNLRLSRTWGFGPSRSANSMTQSGGSGRRGGGRGPGGQGGPGGMGGMRMGGGGGFRGMFDGGSTEKRYNLTLSAQARNLFNHLNPGQPIGNLSSPQFGTANSTATGFGPGGSANNRSLEFALRFSF